MRRTEAGGGGLAATTTAATAKLRVGNNADCVTVPLKKTAQDLSTNARAKAG